MSVTLEDVERLWPTRGIFQGSATAYLRYSSHPQPPWRFMEEPLWEHALGFFNRRTRLLDFGAGTGKVTDVAIHSGIPPSRIHALEPNPILVKGYKEYYPNIRVRRSIPATLKHTSWADGFSVIAANMVINQLDTETYDRTLGFFAKWLRPYGTLLYTIPHPIHKALTYGHAADSPEFVTEEEAPWGGYTAYHHKSPQLQVDYLHKHGFHVGFVEFGYEDSLHGFQIEPYEDRFGHLLRGPRRVMVVARKGRLLPERLLSPPSIRPTILEPYTLQDTFGDMPEKTSEQPPFKG